MALHHIQLPRMGESISEATVVSWLKQPGDRVEEDEAIVEIATDKVDSEVPSPVAGILKEQLFAIDDVIQVGQDIAIIETEQTESTTIDTYTATVIQPQETPSSETNFTSSKDDEIPGIEQLEERNTQNETSIRFYSPLVRNIAIEEGISNNELDHIKGSGSDGRVTKQDILGYISKKKASTSANAISSSTIANPIAESKPTVPQTKSASSDQPVSTSIVSPQDEIIEMDRMRRLIADHMVKSVQTSPHVCSFVEADVTNLVLWREKVKSAFEKREGEKITFTPIFIEAVSKALKDFPMVNISVNGTQIIKKRDINIGMAAALPNGNLIVPVIKHADQLSLVGLTKAVNDLANRARSNKLKPDDTQDGTFTLTNIGAFGNIMGTPIINQPQVAILAVGTIKKKPAVIETEHGDLIGIRHMMYISMSYDHRVVDGSLGGRFIKRVADYLENWDQNREI